jgi:hypothetical protein
VLLAMSLLGLPLGAWLAALWEGGSANPERVRASLRLVYVAIFGFQTVFALTLAVALLLLARQPARPNDTVAWVLLAMSLLGLPLGAWLAAAFARRGGVAGALAGTTAAAVALSGTSWFAALMLATNQRSQWLAVAVALVSIGYALGFALVGRFANRLQTTRVSTASEDPEAPEAPEATESVHA